MLIVIPTFKRTESVRLVLRSLLCCELPPGDEEFRVAVVNNFPPNKLEINKVVEEVWNSSAQSAKWKMILIHREKTLPLIENWYSAIHALAKENEIFILQGDDDLFTPWSLVSRYSAFLESKADAILTHSISGLTFLERKTGVHYSGSVPIKNLGTGKLIHLDFRNVEGYSPVFIGSHAYLYNQAFRDALVKVDDWTSKDLWLDHHHRTIMYAYFIVIASIHLGAKINGLDSFCCIRGTSLNEKLQTPYNSSREANSSFLSLVMLLIFQNEDLKKSKNELATTIGATQRVAADWFLTNYLDKRVDGHLLKRLLRLNPVRMKLNNWLFGFKVILQQHLALKYIRLRLEILFNKGVFTSDDFIEGLK